MTEFLIAAAIMGGMGVLLAALLAIADKKLFVFEDPRIDDVENLLPKANCGACGCAGCRAFAEKAVTGQIAPGKCTVNSPEGTAAIASFLGVNAGTEEKRVARLACAGGVHVAKNRANYEGLDTCRAAALVSGGGKSCSWGCLGLGDCDRVCDFKAIHMDSHGLPVVTENKCTACGDCVEVCGWHARTS
jgi:electron transport complex protein RnfB